MKSGMFGLVGTLSVAWKVDGHGHQIPGSHWFKNVVRVWQVSSTNRLIHLLWILYSASDGTNLQVVAGTDSFGKLEGIESR